MAKTDSSDGRVVPPNRVIILCVSASLRSHCFLNRTIQCHIFSAARSLALRARGFAASSSAVAVTGRPVRILSSGTLPHWHTGNPLGQTQPSAWERKLFLTIRSSREWKEITTARPPGRTGANCPPPVSGTARRCNEHVTGALGGGVSWSRYAARPEAVMKAG